MAQYHAVRLPAIRPDGSIVWLEGNSAIELYMGVHRNYLTEHDSFMLTQAGHLITDRFRHVCRGSGEPLYEHSFAVFLILHWIGLPIWALVATILHDLAEDTNTTMIDILDWFGNTEVATLVWVMTKHSGSWEGEIVFAAKIATAAEFGWWPVLFIKLADIIHNMKTVSGFNNRGKELSYAIEKRDIDLAMLKHCRYTVPGEFLPAYDTLLRLAEEAIDTTVANKRAVDLPLLVL